MGVKGLLDVIKTYSPDAIKKKHLSSYMGQTFAIDASIFCYKYMYKSQTKKKNNHIHGFYTLFSLLYKYSIRVILIFDGSAPELKCNEIQKRKKVKSDLMDKISKAIEEGDTEKAQDLQNRIITFPPETYNDIYKLCDMMDVPYFRANYEADYLCSLLFKKNIVQAVVSNDSDMLMYNINILINNLDYHEEINEIDLSVVLKTMDITYDNFVNLCILLGTDFNSSIKNYGKVSSVNYIMTNKSNTLGILGILEPLKPLMDYDYDIIYNHIINATKSENNDIELEISSKMPNINWKNLGTYLHDKCNCRLSTIERHKDNFDTNKSFVVENSQSTIFKPILNILNSTQYIK